MPDTPWLQTKVGPTGINADGTLIDVQLRTARHGDLVVGWGAGEYEEMATRGELFYAVLQAEITFDAVLESAAAGLVLANPRGSPVDLVLLNIGITIRTATTAGSLVLAVCNNPAAADVTGTAVAVRNARQDLGAGYGKAWTVATLPAVPVALRTCGYCVSTTPVAPGTGIINDEVKGGVVIGPGTSVAVQGITIVGTGIISYLWRERKRIAA